MVTLMHTYIPYDIISYNIQSYLIPRILYKQKNKWPYMTH